jgi:hypothetical protein
MPKRLKFSGVHYEHVLGRKRNGIKAEEVSIIKATRKLYEI